MQTAVVGRQVEASGFQVTRPVGPLPHRDQHVVSGQFLELHPCDLAERVPVNAIDMDEGKIGEERRPLQEGGQVGVGVGDGGGQILDLDPAQSRTSAVSRMA